MVRRSPAVFSVLLLCVCYFFVSPQAAISEDVSTVVLRLTTDDSSFQKILYESLSRYMAVYKKTKKFKKVSFVLYQGSFFLSDGTITISSKIFNPKTGPAGYSACFLFSEPSVTHSYLGKKQGLQALLFHAINEYLGVVKGKRPSDRKIIRYSGGGHFFEFARTNRRYAFRYHTGAGFLGDGITKPSTPSSVTRIGWYAEDIVIPRELTYVLLDEAVRERIDIESKEAGFQKPYVKEAHSIPGQAGAYAIVNIVLSDEAGAKNLGLRIRVLEHEYGPLSIDHIISRPARSATDWPVPKNVAVLETEMSMLLIDRSVRHAIFKHLFKLADARSGDNEVVVFDMRVNRNYNHRGGHVKSKYELTVGIRSLDVIRDVVHLKINANINPQTGAPEITMVDASVVKAENLPKQNFKLSFQRLNQAIDAMRQQKSPVHYVSEGDVDRLSRQLADRFVRKMDSVRVLKGGQLFKDIFYEAAVEGGLDVKVVDDVFDRDFYNELDIRTSRKSSAVLSKLVLKQLRRVLFKK